MKELQRDHCRVDHKKDRSRTTLAFRSTVVKVRSSSYPQSSAWWLDGDVGGYLEATHKNKTSDS